MVMPRFRFQLHDGRSLSDTEDTVLPDLADAQFEAVRRAGTILAHHPREFWQVDKWDLDVTDAGGSVLFTLTVSATWKLGKVDTDVGT